MHRCQAQEESSAFDMALLTGHLNWKEKLSNSPPQWIMSLAGVALGVKMLRLALTQVSNSSSCSIAGRSIHDNQNLSHS